MADETSPRDTASPRVQFGLKGLMLSVLTGCVLLGVAVTMFRDGPNEPPPGVLVILPVLAPMALMVVLGMTHIVLRFIARRRHRRQQALGPF